MKRNQSIIASALIITCFNIYIIIIIEPKNEYTNLKYILMSCRDHENYYGIIIGSHLDAETFQRCAHQQMCYPHQDPVVYPLIVGVLQFLVVREVVYIYIRCINCIYTCCTFNRGIVF